MSTLAYYNERKGEIRNKLLIIDDDYATRLLIKEIIRNSGITIFEASSGKEGLELYIKFSSEIFLVILDILLPEYDGWALLRFFRKIDSHLPVLTVSATLPYELSLKSKLARASGYISKPFSINELKQIILRYYHEYNY